MLNKRAQILFDKETYKALEEIARESGSSVGEIIRMAVKKTYTSKYKVKKSKSLADAAKDTFGAWKKLPMTDKDLANSLSGPWSKPDEIFEKS